MADLAEQVAVSNPQAFHLGSVQWDHFGDGFPNIRIINAESIRNQDVVFLASFSSPDVIFEQLSVLYEIPRYAVRSFKIVLPFYPTGTMERVDESGQIATAATLARMLSAIPMTMSGPPQIVIFDIHALQERFYFSDAVMPRLESAVSLLHERLMAMDDVAIAFPDDGAWKRFGRGLTGRSHIVCQKIRHQDRRIITIREGDPTGRHVVIVDDLAMTGTTLIECKNVLLRHGAAKVSCFVVHGVFPNESWKNFQNAGFTHVWLTDSCPETAAALRTVAPFEILSLAGLISQILK